MKIVKKLTTVLAALIMTTVLYAQNQTVNSTRTETTVEDEYLSNIEDVIISELAASDDYDNKLVALQYLENAVKNGRSSPDMITSLGGLAGEGVTKESRTNGRLTNNFPDVRAKACDLLGEIPTKESKNILCTIAENDKEPMVVSAAIRSLGNIGLNENDDVVAMIQFIHKKFAALNPTSSLAFEILVAYEKLAPNVADKNAMIQSITEIAKNHKYNALVRTRALELLNTLNEKVIVK